MLCVNKSTKYFLQTGDLTDSVAPGNVLVTQFAEEWEMYKALYTKCQNESGVNQWLDLRGNHGKNKNFLKLTEIK
jgi:hypothetical protein